MQQEIQLKLGIMTIQELCDWFHIKRNTYYHSKEKKLEELEIFADFEKIYNGVNITNIKIPIYAKKGSRAYNIIRDNFSNTWHKSGYDTAARVGSQIWRENPELQNMISESTAKAYTSRVRTEFYGRVYKKESGSLGYCKYAYVVSNEWEEAILLTDEQSSQVSELIHKIYTNEQEPYIYDAYCSGQITEEEYNEFQEDWKNKAGDRYAQFIEGLYNLLGFYPTKVTKIIKKDVVSAF